MFNEHNITIPWEMLNQDKKDEDEKVNKQAKNNPNIDEFNLWCFGQLWSNRVVESVHDEHGGDSHGDAGLEMFFSEENCCLQKDMNYSGTIRRNANSYFGATKFVKTLLPDGNLR